MPTDKNMLLSYNGMSVSHSKAAFLTTCRISRIMKMLAIAYIRLHYQATSIR